MSSFTTHRHKLFVDDRRPAPSGWAKATTLHQAISKLHPGNITELSLDYDLTNEKGSALVDWMRRRNVKPQTVHLHSQNPYGVAVMARQLKRLGYEGSGRTFRRVI